MGDKDLGVLGTSGVFLIHLEAGSKGPTARPEWGVLSLPRGPLWHSPSRGAMLEVPGM